MDLGFYSVSFNWDAVDAFFNQSNFEVILGLMAIAGWLILAWLLLYATVHLWAEYRQHQYMHNWKWVLLAIDVPQLNVQTPMAVEQMFNHLSGSLGHSNIAEKFWHGFRQRFFSFEIISIEGYIQFLVRTEQTYRDLVEASIYAQYPDAEITEVEDYVEAAPDKFPNDNYDVWMADFGLTEHWSRPIRTYEEFEHKISKDTVLKDPMGTFLESFSRLGPGEQMWFQMIVEPISNSWKEEVIHEIEKITGTGHGHGHGGGLSGALDRIPNSTLKTLEIIGDQIFSREASHAEEHEKEEKKELAPGQGKLIEAMETKMKKIGFKTKMRGVYLARKEVFRKEKGVNALIGAITQFNIPSSNSFAPTYSCNVHYLFAKQRIAQRKIKLMRAYKKRKAKTGGNTFILNIMELASVWHFPMSHVKTPLIQKSIGKKAEPPSGLPMENIFNNPNFQENVSGLKKEEKEETSKQSKTIYHTDSGDIIVEDQTRFS